MGIGDLQELIAHISEILSQATNWIIFACYGLVIVLFIVSISSYRTHLRSPKQVTLGYCFLYAFIGLIILSLLFFSEQVPNWGFWDKEWQLKKIQAEEVLEDQGKKLKQAPTEAQDKESQAEPSVMPEPSSTAEPEGGQAWYLKPNY